MLVNPRERYFKNKGIEEGIIIGKIEVANRLLDDGSSLKKLPRLSVCPRGIF